MRDVNFKDYEALANDGIERPKNKFELLSLLNNVIMERGANCDLNFIDTHSIDDMSYLFCNSLFSGDISGCFQCQEYGRYVSKFQI